MNARSFSALAATTLTLIASGSALAAKKASPDKLASMDCAALAKQAAAVSQERMKLFSTPSSNPQALGKEMMRIGEKGAAIQTQREAKKCPGAVVNNNDLGK